MASVRMHIWVWGVALALACIPAARAATNVVIDSLDPSGQLTFATLPDATSFRVEWAPAADGPWTNFAGAAATLDAIVSPGLGIATAQVPMFFRMQAAIPFATPPGMVQVPTGSFAMGHATNVFPAGEGNPDELPRHGVNLGFYCLDSNEVSKALWDEVADWAAAAGLGYDLAATNAAGKAPNHPTQSVSWHEAVKWCNARSEKEALAPCYTATDGIYRAGTDNNVACDWLANGYRLPTEAEWEKAARGGAANHRFPWSDADTIQHARANYFADTATYAYDTSAQNGYHPAYATNATPHTSPVGSFAANGYQLNDMAGNVAECCWDWHSAGYYAVSPATDPRGPGSGSVRVVRGGSWSSAANLARVAARNSRSPDYESPSLGFRCARGF